MKHDLEAFARDIVTLIKTSGDSGDTGDRSQKSLRDNDFSVPTRRAMVSPLNSDWGRDIAASGDRKREFLQAVVDGVPTVPAATTQFGGGAVPVIGSDIPAEWHAILAKLNRRDRVDWISPDRWWELIRDATTFLDRWECAAEQLGWTALDLFGVHPVAPAARFDVMGLVFLINGGSVVALTETAATIRRRSTAVLTYRRPVQSGAILISEV